MVANYKQFSQEDDAVRGLFMSYAKIPIISQPFLLTIIRLADQQDWADDKVDPLKLNVSELDL